MMVRCQVPLALILVAIGSLMAAGEEPKAVAAPQEAATASEATARDRARLLHEVYAATLEMMHERYFHGDRAIVPARALEDVFDEVAKKSQVKARWISVNTKPMSVHHEPRTAFEKQAAAEIAAGKTEFELVEQGVYQRAKAIPLGSSCVSCHTGFFAGEPKSPRFAALVIRIPIAEGKVQQKGGEGE
jgi:hypothetical protein